jgi:hypothetical protein
VYDSLPVQVLLFAYAALAPGLAIAWVTLERKDPLLIGTVGTTVGLLGIPLMNFVAAMLLRTHIHAGLLLSTSTIIMLSCYGIERWKKRTPNHD